MKQTAVEWLWEQIDNSIPFQNIQTSQIFNGLLEQAKAMEKKQQGEVWDEAIDEDSIYTTFEQYYSLQTFGRK